MRASLPIIAVVCAAGLGCAPKVDPMTILRQNQIAMFAIHTYQAQCVTLLTGTDHRR